MYILVMKQLLVMAIIVLTGFIFARLFKVDDNQKKFLSTLLLYVINPCLVLNSFNIDFSVEKLKQLCFIAGVAIVLHLIMIVVSILLTLNKNKDSEFVDYAKIERLAIVFTNCGFIGIPLIRGVFGDGGVFYLMGYLVVFNVGVWTFGLYQMSGSVNFKKVITNPNIVAVIIGLVLFCSPISLPEFIKRPIAMISDMNTAAAMILVGIMLANFKMEKKFAVRLIKCIAGRLVVCSAVNLFVIILLYKLFGNMPDMRLMLFVVYICSMCPSATSVPSMSVLFNKDASYASVIVSVTSVVCVFTIPAFVALAEQIIH